MCILLTHSSENGRFGRSPKPFNPKRRLLRGLRVVSKLAVLPQGSRIFRIHILLMFKILFLEAYRFQNSKGLEGLKEYALNVNIKLSIIWQIRVSSHFLPIDASLLVKNVLCPLTKSYL